MQKRPVNIVPIIVRYDPLLRRYAGWLVKESRVAAAIVKEVLKKVYELDGYHTDAAELRRLFKRYTLQMCRHWLRVQAIQKPQKLNG